MLINKCGLSTLIIFHRKGNFMRFNSELYEKVFPRTAEPKEIESAVDTFKPTEDLQKKAMDPKPGDEPNKDPEPPASEPDNLTDEDPEPIKEGENYE